MTEYSGRTTALEHKFDDWKDKVVENPNPAFVQKWIFDVQWSKCPVEVEDEVRQLWRDWSLGNDHCYIGWDEEMAEDYPKIAEYIKSHGPADAEILIHWWW